MPSAPPLPGAVPDFRRLFECALGVYVVLTPDLRIVAASNAYLAATMTTRDAIIGRALFDVFPENPDDHGASGMRDVVSSLDRVRRELVTDSMALLKYDIRRPDADGGGYEERFWSLVNSPFLGPEGELAFIVLRVEDVTEYVRLRQLGNEQARETQALQVRAQQMEAEVYNRAQEISAANRQLSAAHVELKARHDRLEHVTAELVRLNDELEAFSYSVSHDLRAPLRGIDGFSQALLEDYAGVLDDKGRDYLRRVRAGAQRMSALIDDLLQLSRVGRAEMRQERVDLSAIARTIAADLERAEPGRRVRFVIPDGVALTGDSHLFRVVLDNLVRNAWKFTAPLSDGVIELGETPTEGGLVHFVRDNGVGYDPAYTERLFVPFQRLHKDSEFPGTGIGLATVQRIIRRHGGRVWADGAIGRGATFSWSLPASPAGEAP